MQPAIVKPKSVMLHFHKQILPFKKTIAGKLNANCYADLAIANARLFRVGWGNGGHLMALTTLDNSSAIPTSKSSKLEINSQLTKRNSVYILYIFKVEI